MVSTEWQPSDIQHNAWVDQNIAETIKAILKQIDNAKAKGEAKAATTIMQSIIDKLLELSTYSNQRSYADHDKILLLTSMTNKGIV